MVSLSDHEKSGMGLNKAFFLFIILFSPFLLYAGGGGTVIIKAGDTLYGISRRYNVPLNDLITCNNIKDPSALKIGTVLKIPFFYTVRKGDTLYGISRKYSIGISTLCRLNNISSNHVLTIGEKLRVPFKEKAPDAPVVKAENAQSNVALPGNGSPAEADNNLLWPHKGKRIAIKGKLTGEEILGKKGDTIISVSSGKVVWVAPYRGYGKLIMIETKDKHIFAYGGNEETLVKVGDQVKPGTVIGTMGIDPIEKNAKAYFFVYKGGKPVDPRKAPRR